MTHGIQIHGNYYAFDAWFDTCCEWWLSCQTSWLACSIAQEDMLFAKGPLGSWSDSSSFGVLSWPHHSVHLSVLPVSSNKMKHTFEPCKHYCHIHLACMSVGYERKMHVATNYSKIVMVKNLVCFNFVEV